MCRPGTLLRWHSLGKMIEKNLMDGAIVLDLGGYDGFISSRLKKRKSLCEFIVADLDKDGLQKAEQKGLRVINTSATKLLLDDMSVDVVMCLDLIEHVSEPELLMKEIYRVLKNNGKIILTTTCEDFNMPFIETTKLNEMWSHLRTGFSYDELERLFLGNGFIVEYYGRYFNKLSRFVYSAFFIKDFLGLSYKIEKIIWKIVSRLDSFIKYGAKEHVIIGVKMR